MAFQILRLVRPKNKAGHFVRLDSEMLAPKLGPLPTQNTLSRAVNDLRDRMTDTMRDRLGLDCRQYDVIDNRGQGHHLRDWIVVEVHEEAEPVAAATAEPARPVPAGMSDRQQWIVEQLKAGRKLTRRRVEERFNINTRTAKRELAGLVIW